MRKRNSIEFPAFYNVGVGEGGVCWLGAPLSREWPTAPS